MSEIYSPLNGLEEPLTGLEKKFLAEIDRLRVELARVYGEARVAREERDVLQDALDSTMSVFFGENVPEHYEPGHVAVHAMALVAMIEQLRQERDAAEAERDAARAAAATLRKWGATWRSIAWGYEIADDVQIFDNQQQLWATSRPRDCMGRRLDE